MTKARSTAVIAMMAALLGGCGGGAASTSSTSDVGLANYGQPGAAASADRTLALEITPQSRFSQILLTVHAGETVVFSVANQSSDIHQFVLGDQRAQDIEEKTMKSMGHAMSMPDSANAITVAPHTTQRLVWAFPASVVGEVLFGSHEPGDYAHGLNGVIRVASARSNGLGSLDTTTTGP